jgi:hypothetical protein
MTWKTTAILTTLILSGVGIAYAEESTIQVPFDYHGLSCWLESETTYQCTWQGEIEPMTIEELESFKDSISTEVYEEELARLTAPIVVEVTPELTKDEKTILKLESKLVKGTMITQDAVLLQMLRTLDECQQGLGNSSAIQEERTFVISEWNHWEVTNVQVVGQLGELVMAIEECKAQHTLENQTLTVMYKHFEDANRAGNFNHLEALEGVSAIPYSQYTKSDRTVDIGVICNSHAYPDTYKTQMGCEPIKYDGFTYPEGNGLISYYSPILEEYTFFMQDYGNKQATSHDKQVQEGIAQPIADKLIESNLFYQNHKE